MISVAALVLLPHLTAPISTPPKLPSARMASGYKTFVELTISPAGKAVKCAVTLSRHIPDVDRQVCTIMSGETYAPGLDEKGAPTWSRVSYSFDWPQTRPLQKPLIENVDLTIAHPIANTSVHPVAGLMLTLDDHGAVQGCAVEVSTGSAALDATACKEGPEGLRFPPVVDEAGKKVASIQSFTVGFGAYATLVLKSDKHWAALGAAGPYFPDLAVRLNVGGYADLICTADDAGKLGDCEVDEEAPLGFGFSDASRKMAEKGWMQIAPGAPGLVLVRVDFPRPGSFQNPNRSPEDVRRNFPKP